MSYMEITQTVAPKGPGLTSRLEYCCPKSTPYCHTAIYCCVRCPSSGIRAYARTLRKTSNRSACNIERNRSSTESSSGIRSRAIFRIKITINPKITCRYLFEIFFESRLFSAVCAAFELSKSNLKG